MAGTRSRRRGPDEVMTALDAATGRVLWQAGYPLPYVPSPPTAVHGPGPNPTPTFHNGTSPAVDGRLVILHPGNYGPLTAFDVDTGAVKWTAGDGGAFASPIIATHGEVAALSSDCHRRPRRDSRLVVRCARGGLCVRARDPKVCARCRVDSAGRQVGARPTYVASPMN
jgi:outer membrane protein assembly factor BamB